LRGGVRLTRLANPGELAAQLIEQDVEVIEENGAPAGEKLFVFYNPPMVNRNLGIRRSYINEAARVVKEILARKLQTIVFANSRLHTEVLLTYLQQANLPKPGQPEPIRGYRGGYLPGERREIERGLRDGRILGVVATNALELGIDVGSLDACVMAGYPGSTASTWQRAGRAGRRTGSSCAVFVASSAPLDQFIVQHPDYFFGSSPEHAHIQPDNLEILVNHLKCAAFELPISPDERFGKVDLPELCEQLVEAGFLHQSGGNWHWIDEAYRADTISLRSGLNSKGDGGRKKTRVGHHRRHSASASPKDTGRPARQPVESANRVASRLSSAVGRADREKIDGVFADSPDARRGPRV